MQRFEDYNLMGTRQSGPSAAQVAAVADRMVRQTLREMTTKHRRAPTAGRRQKPAPRPSSPAFENRPRSTVAHGGSARLGGNLAWALRELRRTDPAVLRREVRSDPETWVRVLANLDRLTAQVAAGRRTRDGRDHC